MSISNKERASKHATRSRECAGCGKKVRGNGGYTNHVRSCRAFYERYKDNPGVLRFRGVDPTRFQTDSTTLATKTRPA